MSEESELQLMLTHAAKSGNYPVLDYYYKSWIPLKAEMLRKREQEKKDE